MTYSNYVEIPTLFPEESSLSIICNDQNLDIFFGKWCCGDRFFWLQGEMTVVHLNIIYTEDISDDIEKKRRLLCKFNFACKV